MKTSIKSKLDSLHLSDIYSLILFVMYKIQDIPEYAMLSELCYLLDGANLTRLLTYFAGKTITIPTEDEFANMSKALLLYQYVNIEGKSLTEAYSNLKDTTPKQKEQVTDIYLKLIPIMNKYNIDRGQIKHG